MKNPGQTQYLVPYLCIRNKKTNSKDMKNKVLFMLKALAITTTIMCTTSCQGFFEYVEETHDKAQSMAFSGEWTGDFGMYYNYRYAGRTYTFWADYTNIVFYPRYAGATYGTGKQVDYYYDGPYAYEYHSFNWEIRAGIVYLDYPSDRSLNTSIYDYRMTNSSFYGYFGDSNESFSLRKIADYYDWTPYVNTYGNHHNTGWYPACFSRTSPSPMQPDSISPTPSTADQEPDGIISHGRHIRN